MFAHFSKTPQTDSFSPPTKASAPSLAWYKNQTPETAPKFFHGIFHSMKTYYSKLTQESVKQTNSNTQEQHKALTLPRKFFGSQSENLLIRKKKKVVFRSVFLRLAEFYKMMAGNKFRGGKQPEAIIRPIPLRKTSMLLNKQSQMKQNKRKLEQAIDEDLEEGNFLSRLKKKPKLSSEGSAYNGKKRFPKGLFSKMKQSNLKQKYPLARMKDEKNEQLKAKRSFNELLDKNNEEFIRDLEETDEGDSLSLRHMKPNDSRASPEFKDKKLVLSEEEKTKILEEIEKFFNNQDESICKEKKIVLSVHVFQSDSSKRVEIQKKPLVEDAQEKNSDTINQEKVQESKSYSDRISDILFQRNADASPKELDSDPINQPEYKMEVVKQAPQNSSKNEDLKDLTSISDEIIDETNRNDSASSVNEQETESIYNPPKLEFASKGGILSNIGKISPQTNNPFLCSPAAVNFSLTDFIHSQNKTENPFEFQNNRNERLPMFESGMDFLKPPENVESGMDFLKHLVNHPQNTFQNIFAAQENYQSPIQTNIPGNFGIFQTNIPNIQSVNIQNIPNMGTNMAFLQSHIQNIHQMQNIEPNIPLMPNLQQMQNIQNEPQMSNSTHISNLHHVPNVSNMQSFQTPSIFGYGGQTQMEDKPFQIPQNPINVDEKVACHLFSNQNSQFVCQGRNAKIKMRQDQNKLRVNSGI